MRRDLPPHFDSLIIYCNPMLCAIAIKVAPKMYCRLIKGRIHFAHFCHGTFVSDKAAIKYPEVGVKILEIPSPNW